MNGAHPVKIEVREGRFEGWPISIVKIQSSKDRRRRVQLDLIGEHTLGVNGLFTTMSLMNCLCVKCVNSRYTNPDQTVR